MPQTAQPSGGATLTYEIDAAGDLLTIPSPRTRLGDHAPWSMLWGCVGPALTIAGLFAALDVARVDAMTGICGDFKRATGPGIST